MPRPKNSFSSELTYILLLILRHSLVPTKYISLLTGEPSKKISTYLSILKKKGLVYYENGFWSLTKKGESLVDRLFKSYSSIYHLALLINQLKNNKNENIETKFILKNLNLSKDILIYLNKSKEIEISSSQVSSETKETLDQVLMKANKLARKYLGRGLDNVEKAIIRFLYEFYRDTDKTYWMPEDTVPLDIALAEALSRFTGSSISSIDVKQSLEALSSINIIFMVKDTDTKKPKIRISKKILGK